VIERSIGNLSDFQLHGVYEGPSLFIGGGRSDYLSIGSQDYVQRHIQRYFPDSHLETIMDAGHWVHVDCQNIFIKLVTDFLLSHDQHSLRTNI